MIQVIQCLSVTNATVHSEIRSFIRAMAASDRFNPRVPFVLTCLDDMQNLKLIYVAIRREESCINADRVFILPITNLAFEVMSNAALRKEKMNFDRLTLASISNLQSNLECQSFVVT